jgi:Putative prokaryotic signal transducing protein
VLKIVARTTTEMEASLIVGRLKEAGIPCMCRGGHRTTFAGGRSILVEQADLDRARETLKANEGGFDEAELARLSEEAGHISAEQEPPPEQPVGADSGGEAHTSREAQSDSTSSDSHHHFLSALEKLAKRDHAPDHAENPFGH